MEGIINTGCFFTGNFIVRGIMDMCSDIPAIPHDCVKDYFMGAGTLWMRRNSCTAECCDGNFNDEGIPEITDIGYDTGDETKQPRVLVSCHMEKYTFPVHPRLYERYMQMINNHEDALHKNKESYRTVTYALMPAIASYMNDIVETIPLEEYQFLMYEPPISATPYFENILYNMIRKETATLFCRSVSPLPDRYKLSPENISVVTNMDDENDRELRYMRIYFIWEGPDIKIYERQMGPGEISVYSEKFKSAVVKFKDRISCLKNALDGIPCTIRKLNDGLKCDMRERIDVIEKQLAEHLHSETGIDQITVSHTAVFKSRVTFEVYIKSERVMLWTESI